jgi:hypothetical protein
MSADCCRLTVMIALHETVHRWEAMMEQATAKRLFRDTLTRLDALLDPHQTGLNGLVDYAEHPPAEEDLYYIGVLDALGEHLWGCHDVIDAPTSTLNVIGCNLGTTYHEAVLHRALTVINSGILSLLEEVQARHAIFLKDQAGYQRPEQDQATFHTWLQEHVADADELIATDLAQ